MDMSKHDHYESNTNEKKKYKHFIFKQASQNAGFNPGVIKNIKLAVLLPHCHKNQ